MSLSAHYTDVRRAVILLENQLGIGRRGCVSMRLIGAAQRRTHRAFADQASIWFK